MKGEDPQNKVVNYWVKINQNLSFAKEIVFLKKAKMLIY